MKNSLFIAFLLLLAACKTPEVALDPSLTEPAMRVKGRNGFLIGQVIQYGDYRTEPVRRGWTQSYDVPFFVRFQGAKEKLSYTQMEPHGLRAEVSCVSKFKSTELQLVRDYYHIPLEYTNFFAGSIALYNGQENWEFIVHNPNGDFMRERASAGFIRKDDYFIDIEPIRSLKGQPEWMNALTVYGHQFRKDGVVVAAVSTVNQGLVWINEDLPDEEKLVMAAVATGLLLRTDVEGVGSAAVR